jgi:hypothetical protein
MEDKQKIWNELSINHVENLFYKSDGNGSIMYKEPKMKYIAKPGNEFETVEAPPRRASSKKPSDEAPPPAEVPEAPAASAPAATRVRELAQLTSISDEDKAIIMNELKQGINNAFYRLLGKGIRYKDSSNMKKRAKKGNVFEDVRWPPASSVTPPTEASAEVPAPTADVGAAPSANEVAALEQRVRPPPIKKRVLDLRREARSHDLIDKEFSEGIGDSPSDAPSGSPIGGHRRLDLSGFSGSLDLGELRLALKISGPS